MAGYLDYLGVGNADDKTIAVEAATEAPPMSAPLSAPGVQREAKRQNFVTGSLEDAETAEDRHRVRFHPEVNNELVADVLPTDGETDRGDSHRGLIPTERDSKAGSDHRFVAPPGKRGPSKVVPYPDDGNEPRDMCDDKKISKLGSPAQPRLDVLAETENFLEESFGCQPGEQRQELVDQAPQFTNQPKPERGLLTPATVTNAGAAAGSGGQ